MAALIVGCSGQTDPADNITPTSAVLHGEVSCSAGDTGYYYWRYRIVTADEATDVETPGPWIGTAHQGYGCTQNVGPVPIQQTVIGLASGTHYQFELCGALTTLTQTEFCWDKDGNLHAASDGAAEPWSGGSDEEFDTTEGPAGEASCEGCTPGPSHGTWYDANGVLHHVPVTKPPYPYGYDPATDPDLSWDSASEDDHPVAQTDGAGGHGKTGFACGTTHNWMTITQPFPIFKASMSWYLCWGTGAYRGLYQNMSSPITDGNISNYGKVVGWKYDGVVGQSGPLVTGGGKAYVMRNLQFRACSPPPFTVADACVVTNRIFQVKLKQTLWTNSNSIARTIGLHTLIVIQ
jgi:hypothetical protein